MYSRRKIYSVVDDELVPVEQTSMFSEEGRDALIGAGIGTGALGLAAGGGYGVSKGAAALAKKLKSARDEAFVKKLKEDASKAVLEDEKWLEKAAGNTHSGLSAANKWLHKHPWVAAAIATGTIGVGAGIGALVGHKKAEKKYSVLMNEEELSMFSDVCEYLYSEKGKDSAIGAGAGLGVAGLGIGGTYGLHKLATREGAKEGGNLKKADAWVEQQLLKLENNAIGKASTVKNPDKFIGKNEKKALEWISKNPKAAAALAAGVVSTGAGATVGLGVGAYKDHKNKK